MADTPTPKRGYLRPKLGTRPWKNHWDFNWTKADAEVGGLLDGSVPAGTALNVSGTWYAPHIAETSGNLDIGSTINDGDFQDIRVDHKAAMTFDLPCAPIILINIPGVHAVLLGERQTLLNDELGGVFVVRIENNSGGVVDPATFTWSRKGWKFA